MSDQQPRVLGAPDEIWLNYGEPDLDTTHDECYRDGDVTWCQEPVFDSDVHYIRAEIAERLQAQRDELLAALQLAECVYRKNVVVTGEPSSVLDAMQAAIASATKEQE